MFWCGSKSQPAAPHTPSPALIRAVNQLTFKRDIVSSLPLVSVVVPVRNEAAFVGSLIDTIFKQDYPSDRFEVIVADGLSTDGTREILDLLAANYPNLVVLDN